MSGATRKLRVASVQLGLAVPSSREAFFARLDHYAMCAASYGCAFVTLPEMATLPLLALGPKLTGPEALEASTAQTDAFVAAMRASAQRHSIHIVAGSHLTRNAAGQARNVAYLCLSDGTVHAQEKLHPTPDEASVWGIEGGLRLQVFDTPQARVGILICYDSEFPELGRHLADQGAEIVFVPYLTDTRMGHLRVRTCSAARAIENQCYMVLSGNCGTIHGVENIEVCFGHSAILTPCDTPFARDGIAAEASENVEGLIFADLDLELLAWAREHGAVRTLGDRRPDLYRIDWSGE